MARIFILGCLIWLSSLLVLTPGSASSAQRSQSGSDAGQVADLREILQSALRARRPEERQYIDTVVTLVEDGKIPLPLVMSTFQWVRKRKEAKRYPFFYFQRVLRIRGREMGIDVP